MPLFHERTGLNGLDLIKCRKNVAILPAIFFLAFFETLNLYGQDIITLKSGRQLKVTIIEDGEDQVKYRDYGVKNSPLYTVEKSQIAQIKLDRKTLKSKETFSEKGKSGISEEKSPEVDESGLLTVKNRFVLKDGRQLSSRSVKSLMEDIPEAIVLYEKGNRQLNLSNACLGAMVIVISPAATIISNRYDEQSEKMKILVPALAADFGMMIAAIVLTSSGKNKIRQSVSIYNSAYKEDKPLSLRVEVGFTGNGTGFKVLF